LAVHARCHRTVAMVHMYRCFAVFLSANLIYLPSFVPYIIN